jgi:hypothetical protein
MLKQRISRVAHRVLRNRAHQSVEAMDPGQVRDAIHRAAPVPGRIFTLVADASSQRDRVHAGVEAMTHAELREAAGSRLPRLLAKLLEWLDR